MAADLSRLPTGASGWTELVDYSLSLGDLSEVDYLELKSTLPFGVRPERKRSGALIARQILGFANRMPDIAAQHLGGHAVVLVGVTAGKVTGAEEVDGTVLHDSVHPFLGDDGPQWDYQYIAHRAGRVLAIVVDPPQWGNPLYPCAKDFGDADAKTSLRDGDVYVRVHGGTRLATSHDLSQLGSRRDRGPAAGAAVSIQYDGKFDRVEAGTALGLVEQLIEQRAASLLLPEPDAEVAAKDAKSVFRMKLSPSERSATRFREEVQAWRTKAMAKAEYVATEFLRHELGKGHLRIINGSDRYLEAVRVEVQFPSDARVLALSDTDYCDHGGQFKFFSLLPDAPRKTGSIDTSLIGGAGLISPAVQPPRWQSDVEVETTAAGPLARWTLGDLRPRASETCAERLVVLTDAHRDRVDISWHATSRGVNHVYTGELTIECAQEPYQHLAFQPHNG